MKTPLMSNKSGGKAPHCKVCGDESSGFHYGVDSCEGCKGFFRRCITQGMNHKCANEEKCEITPFTRNSCQYCRLKKCFEVGMSREASRLGRRPKRLKEVGGEGSGGARSHVGNVPIAPYPSQQELYRMRMAELQKILQTNGTFKAELMQAFLSAAKASFQEHSKSGGGVGMGGSGSGEGRGKGVASQKQMMNMSEMSGVDHNLAPMSSLMSVSSSTTTSADASGIHTENVGMGGGLSGVDSPSTSLHSPGGTAIDLNMAALDNFLFEQGLPSTPGGMDAVAELQALNSPFNLSSISLDPVSNANSPLPDLGVGSSLLPSSTTNGGGSLLNDTLSLAVTNNANLLNQNVNTPSTSGTPIAQLQLQQYQQYQQQLMASSNAMAPCANSVYVKTEPNDNYSSNLLVKTEPVSPEPMPSSTTQAACAMVMSPIISSKIDFPNPSDTNVVAIMEEVRQVPSETRRLLIEQVTDAVVEAHLSTTCNTYKAVEEAKKRITCSDNGEAIPDMSKLTLDPNHIWQRFISAMVPEITKVVKFCKKLPGFAEIEQDDQIRLIKQGSFEVMMTRFSMLVDHDAQTMIDPTLSVQSPRHVIREMPMGEFLDEFFFVASQFNPLKLTDGEVGLFTSILIICPGRKDLKNVRAIGKIQSLFQQALYFLMKHNHADPDAKFSRLMSLISTFHRINEEHFKALSDIRMKSGGEIGNQFPELHREVFDSSGHNPD